jgi:hypothetical protein
MTTVWVAFGGTESGDDVGPYVFDHEPTKAELQALLMEHWPSEFEMDEEDWIDPDFGDIHISVEEAYVISKN